MKPIISSLVLVCAFLLILTPLQAQKKYKFCKVKVEQVKIVDPGQIMSTYELQPDQQEDIRKKFGEEGLKRILAACQESEWPEEMKDLYSRSMHWDDTKKYTAFRLLTWEQATLLLIPSKKNGHMPAKVRPAANKDMFIFIGREGIQ